MMENETVSEQSTSKALFIAERASHSTFFEDRNWTLVDQIWKCCMTLSRGDLPLPLRGNEQYGITNLQAIADCGKAEFESKHDKFKRTTLAFCIGYVGSAYSGYQQQRGQDVLTVEDDLEMAVQRKSVAAGRTDKGVSALSQITSYNTFDEVNIGEVLAAARASAPCQAGRLVIYQCVRVPRKFHPLFGAIWRRYVYLFPLLRGPYRSNNHSHGSYDVDVDFINQALSKVIAVELSYNGFAHRENRARDESDNCTMYQAQASIMHCTFLPTSSDQQNNNTAVLAIELVANRFLRQMVRILVATVIRESILPVEERKVNILIDICQSKIRAKAAYAAPSCGLGLCGVGYDLEDLRDFRGSNKRKAEGSTVPSSSSGKQDASSQSADTSDIPPRRKPFNRGHGSNSNNKHSIQDKVLPPAVGFRNTACMTWPNDVNVNTVSYWQDFHTELTCLNSDLLFFPERAFAFENCGEIILPHSLTGVGTTIWDAEVLIAHYLDRNLVPLSNPVGTLHCFARRQLKVLELGGGLGLAGLILAKLGHQVWLQELVDVIESLPQETYQSLGIAFIPARWGEDMISLLDSHHLSNGFDLVIAADVFYHEDHFNVLRDTILHSLKPSGNVIFAFEQRRRDLSSVIAEYVPMFDTCHADRFAISKQSVLDTFATRNGEVRAEEESNGQERVTEYYLCHLNGFKNNAI